MSSPLFFSNGDENSNASPCYKSENKETDTIFFVRIEELIPSQPKINSASNDLSFDVISLFLKSSISLLKTTSPPSLRYLS